MHQGRRICLTVVILLVAAWLVLPGVLPRTTARSAESVALPVTEGAPTIAQQITCNSCADCRDKLSSGLYITVTLATDLIDQSGSCVYTVLGESDLVFDCAGHTIDGDDEAIDPDSGIAMYHGSNNTIMNCTVSDFSNGVDLRNATNHTLISNHVTSNGVGFLLCYLYGSAIRGNTADHNYTGIALRNADDTAVHANASCSNSNLDFYLEAGTGNYGDNNVCDSPDGWNDEGTTGCSYACSRLRIHLPLVEKGG